MFQKLLRKKKHKAAGNRSDIPGSMALAVIATGTMKHQAAGDRFDWTDNEFLTIM